MVYTPNVYTSYDKSKTFEENKANGAVIEADKMNALEQQVSKNADDIDSLSKEIVDLGGTLTYVTEEAERVAKDVFSHQNVNTFSFLAITDAHYLANNVNIANSIIHAGQGMNLVRKGTHIDFGVVLGDNGWGSGIEGDVNRATIEMGVEEIRYTNKFIDEAYRGMPNFRVPGNHCCLVYNYSFNDDNWLDGNTLFQLYGAYNAGAVYPSDEKDRGYCYRDFEVWKLRVICVNTIDLKDFTPADDLSACYISGTQQKWLAETIDLSSKENAAEWNIIIFSHHPLDFGSPIRACKILKAYIEGGAVSQAYDDVLIEYDYAGKNAATIIGNIHGHNHNFKVDNLRYLVEGSTTEPIDILRICIPNACFSRSNERGTPDNTADIFDIDYGEEITYNKTAETAQDTAFNVITIDPIEKILYADNYGAGYSRVVPYGNMSTFMITRNLTNCTSSSSVTTVFARSSHTESLTGNSGYTMDGAIVSITMGGVDITSSYSNRVLSIAEVTGDIIITAIAVEIPETSYTNQIPISTDTDENIYNDVGYKTDTYLTSGKEGVKDNVVSTGFIPITGYGSSNTAKGEHLIYLKKYQWGIVIIDQFSDSLL